MDRRYRTPYQIGGIAAMGARRTPGCLVEMHRETRNQMKLRPTRFYRACEDTHAWCIGSTNNQPHLEDAAGKGFRYC